MDAWNAHWAIPVLALTARVGADLPAHQTAVRKFLNATEVGLHAEIRAGENFSRETWEVTTREGPLPIYTMGRIQPIFYQRGPHSTATVHYVRMLPT